MMAYDEGYVVSIIQDGSPVREVGRKVHLPFNSEYKIRLKNKNRNKRAMARVYIDGRKVSNLGDFILHAGQTLDLERFLDHSMSEGNKFKFVPLSDSRVNDPTDSSNGIVKVEFYTELERPIWTIRESPKPKKPHTPRRKGGGWDPIGGGGYFGGSFSNNITASTFYTNDSNVSSLCSVASPASTEGQAGATVEGGSSTQLFVEGDFFLTEDIPTTITLKLRGLAKKTSPSKPGKKRFCGSCGKRRVSMNDRFCSRCGTRF